MALPSNRGRHADGSGGDDFPLQVGRECAAWILGHPSDFDGSAAWLRSLPATGTSPEIRQHYGPILHRLSAAKSQLILRFQNEPEHVVDRLTIEEARGVILYTALVLVPDFDGSFVGLGWDWESENGSVADGRGLMKLGTEKVALADLARRCLMIVEDRDGSRGIERIMAPRRPTQGSEITAKSSSEERPSGNAETSAALALRRDIREWVAAGGQARRTWLLRLWERSIVVPSEFPGTSDRRLWSQLDPPDRLAMHAKVIIGIHDAEATELIIPDARYAEWNKTAGVEPDWGARGRAALGVIQQALSGGTFSLEASANEAAHESLAALKSAHLSEPSAESPAAPVHPIGPGEPAVPALTVNQSRVLQTMALFDSSRLLSTKMIAEEMDATVRLSEETVRQCVGALIGSGWAERPKGERSGARLTAAGRKHAVKIAD